MNTMHSAPAKVALRGSAADEDPRQHGSRQNRPHHDRPAGRPPAPGPAAAVGLAIPGSVQRTAAAATIYLGDCEYADRACGPSRRGGSRRARRSSGIALLRNLRLELELRDCPQRARRRISAAAQKQSDTLARQIRVLRDLAVEPRVACSGSAVAGRRNLGSYERDHLGPS